MKPSAEEQVIAAAREVARYFEVGPDGSVAERISVADGRAVLADLVRAVEALDESRVRPPLRRA